MQRPVILFSIDGLRPDAVTAETAPYLCDLIEQGASTRRARSVMPSVTLPCHTSMLRGVDVPRHGITSNTFQPLARPVPSLMDVASAAELKCGAFFNWGQLRDLYEPESVQTSFYVQTARLKGGDRPIAEAATKAILDKNLDFSFVYYGRTDEAGHEHGWMTPGYLDAVVDADACVRFVVEALREAGREPVVLIQSDHGGHERTHGTDRDEDMLIPWILCGPGVRCGVQLDVPVRMIDTAPTLGSFLGLKQPREWEGRVISEALSG